MPAFPEQPYQGGKAHECAVEKYSQSGYSDSCSDPIPSGGMGLHCWARGELLSGLCPELQKEWKREDGLLSSPLRYSKVKSPVSGWDSWTFYS